MFRRTINVSFPRSGQGLTFLVLGSYFVDTFKPCEYYKDPVHRPEVCPETNFVKTHDFDLAWPLDPSWQYLVLVRHPLYSISSYMRFENIGPDQQIQFATQQLLAWANWTTKWIVNPVPNRLIVRYESLLANPHNTYLKIVRFLSDEPVDEPHLCQAVTRVTRAIPNLTADWLGWI